VGAQAVGARRGHRPPRVDLAQQQLDAEQLVREPRRRCGGLGLGGGDGQPPAARVRRLPGQRQLGLVGAAGLLAHRRQLGIVERPGGDDGRARPAELTGEGEEDRIAGAERGKELRLGEIVRLRGRRGRQKQQCDQGGGNETHESSRGR
jgi:hypothetical protein